MITKKKFTYVLIVFALFFAILYMLKLGEGNELPDHLMIPLPTTSNEGKIKWLFEENKQTTIIDVLLVDFNGKKHRYYVGDEVEIKNKKYILKKIINNNSLSIIAELEVNWK